MVAKQIMVIQTALAAGQRYTVFEGRTMFVNSTLAMFVTMNPMYEHRSVLPSNLKALFRPVAMMVPDYTMIAEVSLYAAGFQSAQLLAVKLVSCLKVGTWGVGMPGSRVRGCGEAVYGEWVGAGAGVVGMVRRVHPAVKLGLDQSIPYPGYGGCTLPNRFRLCPPCPRRSPLTGFLRSGITTSRCAP